MKYGLSDDQLAMRATLHTLGRKWFTSEFERHYDREPEFPSGLWADMAELGLPGLLVPERWGGLGLGPVDVVNVHETLHMLSVVAASALFPTSLATQLLVHGGSEQQRDDLLPLVARGEIKMSFGLTEPRSGSDAAALVSRGERSAGARWVLNGSKTFITAANIADYVFIVVRTNPEVRGGGGLSVAIVPTDAAGLVIRPIDTLGPKFQTACEIFLDNVEVAEEDFLGGADNLDGGWRAVRSSLDLERLTLAAQAVGLAQRALDDVKAFLADRVTFGQPVSKYQAIQHLIADLATANEAGRALVYAAARAMEEGADCSSEVSMAKLFTTETTRRVCLEVVQLFGGYGYTREYPAERYLRRSLVGTIGGGTSQIQRTIIARGLGM